MFRRVCVAQIDIDVDHPDRNIAKMNQIIEEYRGVDSIVFSGAVYGDHR